MEANVQGDDRYKKENIRKAMKKRKEKKKSKKELTEEFIMVSGRRRTKKPPSDVVIAVNDLIRQGFDTSEKISGYFSTKKTKKLNENAKRMYLALVNSKVYVENIRLTDTITNNPLHCFFHIPKFKTKTISNDVLWLNLLNKKAYQNSRDKRLFDISSVYSVWFGSEVYRYDDEKVLKGYYQDFSENFAIIGANGLKLEEKYALLNQNEFNFTYKDNKYIANGDNNACVIYMESEKNIVKNLIENTVEISSNGNGFDMNEKKVELKEYSFKYVDCVVKPEIFCPAFLIMPKEREYSVTVKMNIDYNKFFKFLIDECKYGGTEVYDYLIYWDTLNYFFDFIAVFIVTAKDLSDSAKNKFKNWFNTYNELKPMIELWKSNQIKFQKIAYSFYHAFSGKINYDRLKFLLDKLDEYITDKNRLVLDQSYKRIRDFFNNLTNCQMIRNQFTDEVFGIADSMKKAIDNLIAGGEDIIGNLRKVGTLIYRACLSSLGDENAKIAFPFSISVGVFLGDLWYGEDDKIDVFAQNIESYQERVAKNEAKAERENEELLSKMDQLNELVIPLIDSKIQAKEQEIGFQLKQEESKDLSDAVLSQFGRDNYRQAFLNKKLLEAIDSNKDPNDVNIANKYMNIIENYIKKKKLENESSIIQSRAEMNNAAQVLNNAQSQYADVVSNQQQPITQVQNPVSVSANIPQSAFGENVDMYIDIDRRDPSEIFKQILGNSSSIVSVPGSSLAQFYADVASLSGQYKLNPIDAAKSNSVSNLMKMYPMKDQLIDVVVGTYQIPTENLINYKHQKYGKKNVSFKKYF